MASSDERSSALSPLTTDRAGAMEQEADGADDLFDNDRPIRARERNPVGHGGQYLLSGVASSADRRPYPDRA